MPKSKQAAACASNSERVAWLERAYDLIRAQFFPELPESCEITVGFPSSRGLSTKKKRIGECWALAWVEDPKEERAKTNGAFITIHPELFFESIKVLETLLHETIHVICPKDKHQGRFPRMAKAVGLLGKPTATFAGPELAELLGAMSEKLGPLPKGAGIFFGTEKKQTTRLRKYVCHECSQIIRAATDELTATHEPCGFAFELEEVEE